VRNVLSFGINWKCIDYVVITPAQAPEGGINIQFIVYPSSDIIETGITIIEVGKSYTPGPCKNLPQYKQTPIQEQFLTGL
jgi:hypothetical protein